MVFFLKDKNHLYIWFLKIVTKNMLFSEAFFAAVVPYVSHI